MKLTHIPSVKITTLGELTRTVRARVFEEHLKASIEAVGLVEPLKLAAMNGSRYAVIDGVMRWRAICSIRAEDPTRFKTVPAYIVPFEKRFEVRYQTDIYQDLLPSQLATLVEHLHESERVSKRDIARYIGISTATLRNYTGLWRLVQRGGLFAQIVALMDAGVLPASNPYAWLRLTAAGLRIGLETAFTAGIAAEQWIESQLTMASQGSAVRFSIKFVESVTDTLPADCYRQGESVRALKRDLGLRRSSKTPPRHSVEVSATLRHLSRVTRASKDPVIQLAARSLYEFVK